jgi:hypothetical protein
MNTTTTQTQGGEMTTQDKLEENKRIVRAFIETAFNKHQTDRVADYLTPDMISSRPTTRRSRPMLSVYSPSTWVRARSRCAPSHLAMVSHPADVVRLIETAANVAAAVK